MEIKNEADAKGNWAEFLARLLFRLKGYRIVAVNYVTGRGTNAGEVDFVACRQNVIVFVEVKQRSSLEKAALCGQIAPAAADLAGGRGLFAETSAICCF